MPEDTLTGEQRRRRAVAKTYQALRWTRVSLPEGGFMDVPMPALSAKEPYRLYLYRTAAGEQTIALDLRDPSSKRLWVPTAFGYGDDRYLLAECSRARDARAILFLRPGDRFLLRMTPDQAQAHVDQYFYRASEDIRQRAVKEFGSLDAAKLASQVDMLEENFGWPTVVEPKHAAFLKARGVHFHRDGETCAEAAGIGINHDVGRAVRSVFLTGAWPEDVDPSAVLRDDESERGFDDWKMPTKRAARSESAAEAEVECDCADEADDAGRRLLAKKRELERAVRAMAEAAGLGVGGSNDDVDVVAMFVETLSTEEVDAISRSIVRCKHPPAAPFRVARDGKLISTESWLSRRKDDQYRVVADRTVSLLPEAPVCMHVIVEWVGIKLLDDRNFSTAKHMYVVRARMLFAEGLPGMEDKREGDWHELEWAPSEESAIEILDAYMSSAQHDPHTRASLTSAARVIMANYDPDATDEQKQAAVNAAMKTTGAAFEAYRTGEPVRGDA